MLNLGLPTKKQWLRTLLNASLTFVATFVTFMQLAVNNGSEALTWAIVVAAASSAGQAALKTIWVTLFDK